MAETNKISVRVSVAQRIAEVISLRIRTERLMHEFEESWPAVCGTASEEFIPDRTPWMKPHGNLDDAIQTFNELVDYLAERELDGQPDVDEIDLKRDRPLAVAG